MVDNLEFRTSLQVYQVYIHAVAEEFAIGEILENRQFILQNCKSSTIDTLKNFYTSMMIGHIVVIRNHDQDHALDIRVQHVALDLVLVEDHEVVQDHIRGIIQEI